MVPGNGCGPDWAWLSSGSSWESVGDLPISAMGFSTVGFSAEGLVLVTAEESDADSCHFSLGYLPAGPSSAMGSS